MVDIASIKNSKSERKQQLQDELEHLLEQLKDFNILKVILFGSLIEDNIDINSDIDLLIIMPNSKSTKEWTNIIYETIERNIASDLVIYNANDFKKMLPTSSFLQHIIETGKILYEET